MENILKNSRWRMHRMGLIDFWYYTDEEFYFENGHMLLRGSNGSGKSVTLQSIIPLLLDGNKSSERLDSFGTRARKMETYLINEESDRNDRIGYLYLEFKREDSEIYKTIGMGLRARKNKPLESWYFVIEDNRRIKIDIKLFDKGLAITKQTLKNIIGDQLIEQQKDYLIRVNKALFGFDDINDYKETINLLVQLRSPKLSNSLKPTLINEILNNSLQPLSEEDLRPMSDAISNLDEIESQLAILKQSYHAAKQIYNHYDQYNYYCLDTKAAIALNKRNKVYNLKKDIDKLIEDKDNDLKRQEEIIKDKENLEIENDTLNEELKIVDNPELYKLSEDLSLKKDQLLQTQIELDKKLNQEDTKYEKFLDLKKEVKEYQEKLEEIHLNIDDIIKEMDSIQDDISFDEHYALKEEMYNNLKDNYDYTYIFNKIETEIKRINEALVIFERIRKENTIIDRINNEIETNEVYIENIENKIKKYTNELYELIDRMIESFSLWNDTNNYLKISKDDMFNIINILQEFEYEDKYSQVEEIITNTYNKLYQELSSNKVQKKIELENLIHERMNIESELNHWKTLEDVIPNEDEYMRNNRKYLDEEGVKYQSFYSLLEFDENVSDSYKNNFEEMLSRMGMLNTLVINENDRYKVLKTKDGLADSYLFTTKNIDELEICYINESKDLIDILDEFSIDNSGIEIINGIYQNGIITGTISKQVKSIYIGKHSREQYREAMIDDLKGKLISINLDIDDKKYELDKLDRDIQNLNNERIAYPRKDDLIEIRDEIKLSNLELDKVNEQIRIKKEELLKKRLVVKEYNLNITQIAEKLGISCLENVFYDRKDNFETYQKELNNLKIEHIHYISNNELYHNCQNNLENLESDLDTIRYEKNNLESDIKKLESQIISLEKQLEDKNYGDKKKRIIEIKDRLNKIKIMIEDYTFKLGNIETSIKQNIENLALKENEYAVANSDYDYSYNVYLEELGLNYVSDDKLEIDDVHKYVSDKYPKLDKKETINNNLQTSFHNNKGSLNEYRINLISIFDDEAQRLDIVARFQGNNIKFNELLSKLEVSIEEQKLLFDERDRYLVEDILINTLSSKIRQHIQSSRKWIEKMNQHMDSMKTSSGLNISLKWHARKGQNEDELNSNELVTILEKDQEIRKDSDSKKISSHFRSKIKTARQLSEMEGNKASFHQIMKDIMDYRSWFDFEMWYQKIGENKKEMTNNAFFAFSGGEKAMAMYIPLFSAVAAKYDQAKEDTPMIIALDEAFAGVDEKNIDNLFALIDKFKFDYIMNSQVLWGDYQSVKTLAIHELFRPENAHYVTVISYKWNGKSKSMVNDIWA